MCSECSRKLCSDENFHGINFSFRKCNKSSLSKIWKYMEWGDRLVVGIGRMDSREILEYMLLGKSLKKRALDPNACDCSNSLSQADGDGVTLRRPSTSWARHHPQSCLSFLPAFPVFLPSYLLCFPLFQSTVLLRQPVDQKGCWLTLTALTPDALLQTPWGPSPTVLILFFHE